jgi:hypothetical protein
MANDITTTPIEPQMLRRGIRSKVLAILGALLLLSVCLNVFLLFFLPKPLNGTNQIPLPLGYQPFEYPRNFGSQPLIGAIVAIGPKRGFTYVSHLSKCGINQATLIPQEGVIALPTISQTYSASGGASVDIGSSTTTKGEGRQTGSFTVTLLRPKELFIVVGDVMTDALTRADDFKRLCGNFLDKDDKYAFWIPTAIISDEFEISYASTGKGTAALDATQAIKGFATSKLGLSGDGEYTANGTIKYKGERLYIGFREAYPVELLTGRSNTFTGNENTTTTVLGDFIYSRD